MTLLKYKDHLSMDIIRTKCKTENTFTFAELTTEKTEKGFRTLNSNKDWQYFDILSAVIKETSGSFRIYDVLLEIVLKKLCSQHFLKQLMLLLSIKSEKRAKR